MAYSPPHEVYDRNMILAGHGCPQFFADPEGNTTLNIVKDDRDVYVKDTDEKTADCGIPKITIGDVGYFE